MSEVTFRVQRQSASGRPMGGWIGTVTMPFVPGAAVPASMATTPDGAPAKAVTVTAKAATKTAAAKKAAAAALKMLDNPAVQAVLPPQAALALKVAKKIPFKRLKKLFG